MRNLSKEDIQKGILVRHRFQPDRMGMLTGKFMEAVALMVEVSWGHRSEYEPINALELFDNEEDKSLEGLVQNGRYEKIETLRSLMTFEKLKGSSLSNVMYSMSTSDINFYPHQFVPVLRYINSPINRLLIADEVGLGKTIEAGLIWTECRARNNARRLLVVCPPTLIPKWIRELSDRFSIDAKASDAADILKNLKELKERPYHSFALVASYHALRPTRTEKDLIQPWMTHSNSRVKVRSDDPVDEWQPRPALFRTLLEWAGETSGRQEPAFDLVVFDEAHLMKNTATSNHLVGEVFSSESEGLLALSATPLTTNTRDLYSLLKLVDQDMFRDEATYTSLIRRNRAAVRLSAQLEAAHPNKTDCLNSLSELPQSMARNNLHKEIQSIEDFDKLNSEERVSLRAKANRLNELGSFLSRTRKVEIRQHKASRHPVTLEVHLTKEEYEFYQAMLALIRKKVREMGDNPSTFHLIQPALMMTSCLPVMAEKLRNGSSRWGDEEEIVSLEGAISDDFDQDTSFVGGEYRPSFEDMSWLPNYDFEKNDSKFIQLKKHLLEREKHEKVIIFAFFKDSLGYLQRRIESECGMKCLLVTGDIKDRNERDRLLRGFKESDQRVLLCSEVAAEGVDLQFCRVMINYDLPWNPMRVEQRIGRIDRIGQTAKSIAIVNFHVNRTIDGSIYQHLFSNIGIFQDTVGSLDGILGEKINKLTKELLDDNLSPDEIDERTRLVAAAIAQEKALLNEINENKDSLLGVKSYIQESVENSRSLGRYIKPSELRLYVDEYFSDVYSGKDFCQLSWDSPRVGCVKITLSFKALSDYEQFIQRHRLDYPKNLNRGDRTMTMTFDPETHQKVTSEAHKNIELVNHLHSLVLWIKGYYENANKEWHPVSAIRLKTDLVPKGIYSYGISRVTLENPKLSREELLFRVANNENLILLPAGESEALVNQSLDRGTSWISTSGFPEALDSIKDVFGELVQDAKKCEQSFIEELELKTQSRRIQVNNHFGRKIENLKKRLTETLLKQSEENKGYKKSLETKIKRLTETLNNELSVLDGSDEVEMRFRNMACGLILVDK